MRLTLARFILMLGVWAGLPGLAMAQAGTPPGAAVSASPGAVATVGGLAGVVKRSEGDVSLERNGQRQPAAAGMAVMTGDTLRTGPGAAVGITLRDDTLMTLGPDGELVINSFAFDATTHDGNLLTSLWRGTLHMITGLIAKKAPEQVNVRTRTVVLGARGTEFIVETQPKANPT